MYKQSFSLSSFDKSILLFSTYFDMAASTVGYPLSTLWRCFSVNIFETALRFKLPVDSGLGRLPGLAGPGLDFEPVAMTPSRYCRCATREESHCRSIAYGRADQRVSLRL